MNKDLGIKVLFVVVLLFSVYLLISGFFVPGDSNNDNNSITENDLQLSTYILNMKIGEEYIVYGTVVPDNATDKSLNWYSSNPNIATVNNGVVKAVGPGKTIIKVSTNKANITTAIPFFFLSDLRSSYPASFLCYSLLQPFPLFQSSQLGIAVRTSVFHIISI